jgi:CRP-like cAMP-binding protein
VPVPIINNRLLRRLSTDVSSALLRVSDLIHLDLREPIYEANKPILFIDFPESGVMSLVRPCDDGTEVEVANIGNEGLVGMSVTLGVSSVADRAFCQVEGSSYRMATPAFLDIFANNLELRVVCHRYLATVLDQMSSNIGCNETHTVENRCARWLLLTHDRVMASSFVLTQEFLAIMLCISRTSVNKAAGDLAEKGLIRYSRGKITILDRPGLELASCGCYLRSKIYFDEIMIAAVYPAHNL